MDITADNTGATGDPPPDYIRYIRLDGLQDTGTVWTIPNAAWGQTITTTPEPLDCTEAITILEEAEYELKELLKKASSVAYPVMINGKTHLDLIEISLRDVQKALRALLKIGG